MKVVPVRATFVHQGLRVLESGLQPGQSVVVEGLAAGPERDDGQDRASVARGPDQPRALNTVTTTPCQQRQGSGSKRRPTVR